MALIYMLQMVSRACHIFLPDIVALLIYSSSDVIPAISGHFSTVLLADTIRNKSAPRAKNKRSQAETPLS